MSMNLRCDTAFVEDDGWRRASGRYEDFLKRHEGRRLILLELGVGANTPVIIKYPFWQMTNRNPKAVYVCINLHGANAPREIADRSICIEVDIGQVLALVGKGVKTL